MTRKLFAATNTPLGFVNFFEHIMLLKDAKRRYFLKGPSGSGKSTFMKAIAAKLNAADFATEQFHCANDAASLDAITIFNKGLSIIDATTPHVCDPQIPVAIDVLIDFAQFVDEEKICRRVDEIRELSKQKTLLYNKATKPYSTNLSSGHELDRKLFLSAITPDGFVDFSDSIFDAQKIHEISDDKAANQLMNEANTMGLKTESFYCALNPAHVQYLHVVSENIVYAVKSSVSAKVHNELDAMVTLLKKARDCHYEIEEIYAGAIDFAQVDKMTNKVAAEILYQLG